MNSCTECIHMVEFQEVSNADHRINTCSGDGWEEEDDGLFMIPEISTFDESNCLMFKQKKE